MLKKRILIPVLSLLCLLSFPADILACACCAEPGTYRIETGKPDQYKLGLLDEMKFDKTATLYTDARGFEDLKGLAVPSELADADEFDLVASFIAKTWKFTLKSKDGKSGTLTLPIPTQMVSFAVDIHDGAEGDPSLYKEFRFKGNVSTGTGLLKAGIVKPTTYFLVFQGRGNNCDNASDFTHWRLEISGRKADYAFYGELASAATP